MRVGTVSTTRWEDEDTALTQRMDWWYENGNVYTQPSYRRFVEAACKAQALLMLLDKTRRLSEPSQEEWLGVNLLERDEQLPRRKQS